MNFKSIFKKNVSGKEKISKAQQSTLLIVGLTSIVVGAGIVMIINLNKYISFNSTVIAAKDEAKKNYSSAIQNSGACKSAKSADKIYTDSELKNCSPNDIDFKDVPGTLRFNVLSDSASDISLESIARTSIDACINEDTGVQFTHDELEELYENANSSNEKRKLLNTIKNCSALRVIPDALPVGANTEALLASLNQIYLLSDWSPDSLAPISSNNSTSNSGYFSIPVSLRMEDAHNDQVMTFLGNLNKSIRYFSITSLKIDAAKGFDNVIDISANAEAYYTNNIENMERNVTLRLKDGK